MHDVNNIAVIGAAVASMVIGALWYGPLFGKKWIKLMGMSADGMKKAQSDMAKSYILMFIGSLVTAYVLSIFLDARPATDFAGGAVIGFWAWLGFIGPFSLSSVLWEKKPWELWVINNGHSLAALVIMGGIVAAWQ